MTGDKSATLARLLTESPVHADQRAERMVARELPAGKLGLVLCGAGWLGCKLLGGLRDDGVTPLAFADNNSRLHATEVDGLRVISLEEAVQRYPDACFVIAAYNPTALAVQLRSLGVAPTSARALAFAHPRTLLPQNAIDLPSAVLRDAADVLAAADVWADEESEAEYEHLVRWHLLLDPPLRPSSPSRDTYFPPGIVQLRRNERFVDCGAFDGDSLRGFLARSGGHFERVDALEPDPVNLQRLSAFVKTLTLEAQQRIHIHPVAVGGEYRTVRFRQGAGPGSTITEQGELTVRSVPLDDELSGVAPTYMKVDVEGAEPDVLRGAKRLIAEHAPTMAIVLYHRTSDMWTIPLALRRMRQDYQLYLRRYAEDCWETVCHAVRREG